MKRNIKAITNITTNNKYDSYYNQCVIEDSTLQENQELFKDSTTGAIKDVSTNPSVDTNIPTPNKSSPSNRPTTRIPEAQVTQKPH